MKKEMFFQILDKELELATGCTEPGAIALTGAYAGAELNKLGDTLCRIEVNASTNIIKNAMAAGIPGTTCTGIPYAAAIGTVRAQPERQLEVIDQVEPCVYEAASKLVQDGAVTMGHAQVPQKLYIEVTCHGRTHTTRAIIADLHTHLVLLEADGEALIKAGSGEQNGGHGADQALMQAEKDMTLREIFDFCTEELDPMTDPIRMVRKAVEINGAISTEGLRQEYGLSIGRGLQKDCQEGRMTQDMVTNAMIAASAAADARMAGAPFSVVANTGSGNQGITATVPVLELAQWLEAPEEKMLRAVVMSHLVAIRIKSGFGRLSALCGATVAGTGAACGITYLLGGGYDAVCYTIHNMIGNVAGMLCDGAKPDCALKISICVNAAFQAAFMALRGVRVTQAEGIVEQSAEDTIDNFARLGNQGSGPMDAAMLQMMLNKKKVPQETM